MTRTISVAGRSWHITAYPLPGAFPVPHWGSWAVLVAGLLLTGLLALYLRNSLERHSAIEQMVAERTGALRESEDRFRRLVDLSPDAILVGRKNLIVAANKAAVELFGVVSPSDLIGSRLADFVPAEQQAAMNDTLQLMYLREMHLPLTEGQIRCADGTLRDVEVGAASFREGGGRVVQAVLRDITGRKQTEIALRESEERFRIMADSCPTGIWVTDPDGGIRFINRTYRKFCGVTSEELERDAWQSRLHPDDAPEVFRAFQRALKEHRSFKAEGGRRRADGEWRWVESHAEPRFSSNGEFLGLVGTSKDVSDRKQAEQALHNSEQKFRQLAENIREVIWMVPLNADGTPYVSPAYESIWGRSCDSVYQDQNSSMSASAPMTWTRRDCDTRQNWRGKLPTRSIAYEPLTGWKNGFGTGHFPFATKPGSWFVWSALQKRLRSESSTSSN